MFDKNTVFILGAGASWHYGYPTGEHLVLEICHKLDELITFCIKSARDPNVQTLKYPVAQPDAQKFRPGTIGYFKTYWENLAGEARALKLALETLQPLVIDYFLGMNPSFQKLGTFMIGWVLNDRAQKSPMVNYNRLKNEESRPKYGWKDNWCRFILHQLLMECRSADELKSNRVTFITFNYDTSLEQRLRAGLLQNRDLITENAVNDFFGQDRVLHMYGTIGKVNVLDGDIGRIEYIHAREQLDAIYDASQNIKVIDPDTKDNSDLGSRAREALEFASNVYILGFGFDANNCRRLDLEKLIGKNSSSPKSIFFTNFGDINIINKRASRILTGRDQAFLPGQNFIKERNSISWEKSVRDVYGALELDFEPFEIQDEIDGMIG